MTRPGLVSAVRSSDGVRWMTDGDLPDGTSSVFEIGSVTKVVTALLLADLVREGVVSYDDPVSDHLPVAMPIVGRPITLEDLSTHHSGLPRLPRGTLLRGLTTERHDPYVRFDEAELSRAVARTPPKRPPGRKFAYSNLGAGLLGWALARAAGTSYADLVADRVSGPLGLTDTWFDPPPGAEARIAPGHNRWGRPAHPWHLAALAGAGGLRSTVPDLLRLLSLFAEGATGPLAEAGAETRRPRHRLGRMQVGLGWLMMSGDGRTILFHDGGTGGYRSFAAVETTSGDAVVILSARARGVTGKGLKMVRKIGRADGAVAGAD